MIQKIKIKMISSVRSVQKWIGKISMAHVLLAMDAFKMSMAWLLELSCILFIIYLLSESVKFSWKVELTNAFMYIVLALTTAGLAVIVSIFTQDKSNEE